MACGKMAAASMNMQQDLPEAWLCLLESCLASELMAGRMCCSTSFAAILPVDIY